MERGAYVGKFGNCGCCRSFKGVGETREEDDDGRDWG